MAASEPAIDTAAVSIDYDYDQDHASLGNKSRYADLVRARADWFDHAWGTDVAAARMTSTAWRIATAPTATPGYVLYHRRIFDMVVDWTDIGLLIARIELITRRPEALAAFVDDAAGRRWYDWPQTTWDHDPRETPADEEVLATPFVLSSSVLMFHLACELPQLGTGPLAGDALVDVATQTVTTVVAAINEIVSPAIALLEA
jgi:hypothetical protein